MSFVAVALVLVSAVMHASWNTLARKSEEPYAFFFTFNLVAVFIWFPVAIISGWGDWPSGGEILLISGSGVLQVLYFVFLASAYARGGLTIVYPVARGTGVAVVPLAAYMIFSERPSIIGWLGIAATLTGLLLIAVSTLWVRKTASESTPTNAILFALLTGLVISTYSLVDNYGVEKVDPVVYGYGLILAAVIIQIPFAATYRRAAIKRQLSFNRLAVVLGAVLSMGTYMLVLFALTQSNVGYVVPLRETSIVFAVVLGTLALQEQVSNQRLVSAAVIVAGCLGIAIGG